MKHKKTEVLVSLIIINFFARIQFVTMGIIFYEENAYRTQNEYVSQSFANNFKGLGYISIMLLPTMILYKILHSAISREYEKTLKIIFLIILFILLDIAFYANGGLSITRTVTNFIALNN